MNMWYNIKVWTLMVKWMCVQRAHSTAWPEGTKQVVTLKAWGYFDEMV